MSERRVIRTGASSKRCSRCRTAPRAPGNNSWCRKCRNLDAAQRRPKYSELSDEEKKRSNAASTANVYLGRGHIKREPCPCGSTNAQMHHRDYSKPLDVVWLCRWCHDTEHLAEAFGGQACAVCGVNHPRVLRRHQFADREVVLCANHAAAAGRRPLKWAAFAREAASSLLFHVKKCRQRYTSNSFHVKTRGAV